MALLRALPPDSTGARDVLRAVRRAVDGPGPPVLLGSTEPVEVAAGTAAVITTSGSTGYPKTVVLSRSALMASAFATTSRIGPGAWLLALPPTYVAGLQVLVRSLMSGREPAVLEGSFTPRAFASAARLMASSEGGRRVPILTSLVPAQLLRLLDAAADADVLAALRSFAAVLVGGQALPEPVRERAAELGVRVVRTYGATETSGGCVYDGVPLEGVRMRVEGGELLLAGPMLADGYLDAPERTAASFVRDAAGIRWYRTGDAGEIEHGTVRVTGRVDNVIVSGGVNISLDRVERIVRGVPALAGAVVVAVPDPRWGEASVIVVPAAAFPDGGGAVAGAVAGIGGADGSIAEGSDAAAALAAARAAVEAALGAPARPARILPVVSWPTLPSGKPDLATLRRLAARHAG